MIDIFIFCIGLCFGSFISALSYRLSHNLDYIFTRSFCTNCKKSLSIIDLIPVISYLIFRKCRNCGIKISSRYIIIELISAIGTLVIYNNLWYYPISNIAIYIGIFYILVAMCITDLEYMIVPDSLQILLLILSLIKIWHIDNFNIQTIYPSIILGSIFVLIRQVFIIFLKKDALGIADIKFVFIGGLMINIYQIPEFLMITGVIGTIFGLIWNYRARLINNCTNGNEKDKDLKNKHFPFIPALAISLFLCLNNINVVMLFVHSFIK